MDLGNLKEVWFRDWRVEVPASLEKSFLDSLSSSLNVVDQETGT